MRGFHYLAVLTACGGVLLAQSIATKPDPKSESTSKMTQTVMPLGDGADSLIDPSTMPSATSPPPIINVFTIMGLSAPGTPCTNCGPSSSAPTVSLPEPVGKAALGTVYQTVTYLVDLNYSGPCTFVTSILDRNKRTVDSVSQTLTESAGTLVFVSADLTVNNVAAIGLGVVTTTAVCGSTTTMSKSPVFLACVMNPPHCK